MSAVDLDADLIPGSSAAGWQIGARLWECTELVRGATEVTHQPEFSLNDAIHDNAGVLVVRNFPLGSGNKTVYFGADVVRFDFNAADELYCIWVFGGYRGRAFGRVGIGSPVGEMRALFPVFFDAGDELFYPDVELAPSAPSGIGFYTGDGDPPDDAPILAISIHDWGIMRRAPAR